MNVILPALKISSFRNKNEVLWIRVNFQESLIYILIGGPTKSSVTLTSSYVLMRAQHPKALAASAVVVRLSSMILLLLLLLVLYLYLLKTIQININQRSVRLCEFLLWMDYRKNNIVDGIMNKIYTTTTHTATVHHTHVRVIQSNNHNKGNT